MDATADDNFFIEEPSKLRNSFYNPDRSIQMVELLTPKLLDHNLSTSLSKKSSNNNSNSRANIKNRAQLTRIQPTCRLSSCKKLQLVQHTSTMPKSLITRLEILCQATHDSNDISVAKQALDTLVSASKSGCCFLEKYIVMLLDFCTKKDHLANDPKRIKAEELLNRVLTVDFDRQQLTENLRRPEHKINSADHLIQLLRKVRDMLDYREQTAIDWLIVLLDAYFVELATMDEAIDIFDQISAHINSHCALLRETESTKCLLRSILEQLDLISGDKSTHKGIIESIHLTPYYSIDSIEI